MCKHAVDRSQGQLVDITICDFVNEELLEYISNRRPAISNRPLSMVFSFSFIMLPRQDPSIDVTPPSIREQLSILISISTANVHHLYAIITQMVTVNTLIGIQTKTMAKIIMPLPPLPPLNQQPRPQPPTSPPSSPPPQLTTTTLSAPPIPPLQQSLLPPLPPKALQSPMSTQQSLLRRKCRHN
ncbi:unnamed protein product [Lactuca virosa]|uniref:Uncharacterized protein n=1 Tax=Lactuca virosa TaxID=75947 RepID=A0AAU9P0A4_9ASTR|nr:unnamed protein product [Lactuca virosa]